MKYLFVLLFAIPFLSDAQECNLKKEKDSFTQQPMLSTGFMKFASTASRVSLNMVADSKEIKLLFSMGDGGCYDNQSTIAITFDGSKTKSTQKNATAMNCDGIVTIVFRNGTTTPGVLNKIATKTITSFIITDNTKKKFEFTLKENEKQLLMERAACLVNEAKTLIKTS